MKRYYWVFIVSAVISSVAFLANFVSGPTDLVINEAKDSHMYSNVYKQDRVEISLPLVTSKLTSVWKEEKTKNWNSLPSLWMYEDVYTKKFFHLPHAEGKIRIEDWQDCRIYFTSGKETRSYLLIGSECNSKPRYYDSHVIIAKSSKDGFCTFDYRTLGFGTIGIGWDI